MKALKKIGPNGELYSPTIVPAKNFNAEEDAKRLRDAMKIAGTNEDELIDVLTKRSQAQRDQIEAAYLTLYGRTLREDIESEVSGDFEKALVSLLLSQGEILADECHRAIAGAGTDEGLLAEIIGSATNSEIRKLKDAYQKKYEKDLIKEVENECGGDFKRCLVSILQANRIEPTEQQMKDFEKVGIKALIDVSKAEELHKKLYNAGDGRWGTDEETFISIICRQSVWMLAAIDSLYQKNYGKSIIKAIESEFNGDEEKVLKCIAQSCLDRPGLYARLIHESLSGAGTSEDKLTGLIVSRSEIDLGTIKEVYASQYGKSLEDAIKGDISGNYEKVIVGVLLGNN